MPNEREVVVHMIANAHVDPVWLWRADEGFRVAAETCRSVLELMDEFPDLTFARSSAAIYRWLEENEPELFARIRQRVAEGRWAVVGGWWVQADCNIPCGESFVRQALYAKRYFREKFGLDVRVGYNVDSFGHAATLPQILKKSGMDYYCFFRPGPHEKELPSGLFLWEAPDGSRVVSCRPPHHYNSGPGDLGERIAEAAAQAPPGQGAVMCFFGVGDHGGGPTRENVESILACPNAIFSTPGRYFAEGVRQRASLPVVAEELQHHARGCYTAHSEIKRLNRELEVLLLTAERFATLAHEGFGEDSRQAELQEVWQTLLFHQFHDILAGTSIPGAYDDARQELSRVREKATAILFEALEDIGTRVATTGEGEPVVFFNPCGCARTEVVEIEPPEDDRQIVVLDRFFEEVPSQWEDGHLVFPVRVPSLGYVTYHISPERERRDYESSLRVSPEVLESSLVRLTFSQGRVVSLVDKRSDAELLAGPGIRLVVLDDPSDTWGHGVAAFRDQVGVFEPDGEPEVVEAGPVRAALRLLLRWGESTAELTWYLYDGLPRVDVCLILDWRERHKFLKFAVPTAIERPTATYEVAYGALARPANGEEEPLQRWLDLSGEIAGRPAGLALINDSKYGGDVLGSEMRLSLARSPIFAFHDPAKPEPGKTYQYLDQGEQMVRLRLLPHAGQWQEAGVVQEAESLNFPLYFRHETVQDGLIGPFGCAVGLRPGNLVLTVLKKAEEGDALVARFYESAGREADASLDLHFAGLSWSGHVGPFEIKTILFDLVEGTSREVDMLEEQAKQGG